MTQRITTPSRRAFMGLACCAAAATLGRQCWAQEGEGAIDVHHHVSPPIWLEQAREQIAATNRNSSTVTGWTAQKSLDDMDQNGVRISMLSITNPGTWFGDAAKSRILTRGCNDYMAGVKQKYPGRFGVLAALPMPDTEGSLKEIQYALDTLKVDGFGLMTNYDDKWLGDATFKPVLEELNRRGATIYVHPNASACCTAPIADVSPSVIEFPLDTTRTIVSLLFSGALADFPKINWIFSHAGGTLPMLAERITNIIQNQPRLKSRIPNGAMYEMRKLYYDLAQGTSPMQIAALTKMVDSKQIVFGSDFPFWSSKTVQAGMKAENFSAEQSADIWYGNARRLFPALG